MVIKFYALKMLAFSWRYQVEQERDSKNLFNLKYRKNNSHVHMNMNRVVTVQL